MNEQKNSRAELGRKAEQAVAVCLTQLGFVVLDRNFCVPRVGEIDLIGTKAGNLYVIEVKARSNSDLFGGPAAAITAAKCRRLRVTTQFYLKINHMMNCDVIFLAALVDAFF